MFDRIDVAACLSRDPDFIARSERIVLPGVGHFGATMDAFKRSGLEQPLRHALVKGSALLGVCVGAQMLMSHGEEGNVPGLDIIPGRVVRFNFDDLAFASSNAPKIPHMGWRSLRLKKNSALFQTGEAPRFYFTHSFYSVPAHSDAVIATAHYGYEFTAAFSRERIWGVQFHPEKSHLFGMDLLSRFASV